MSRIRILSERVANQIAAGEVVERPAAAVKELVENALDAGATRIAVEFRAGGRELIRVEDDGQGMDRDDALLALQRHATSKIAEAEDLQRLGSFGFRGEALPSIASVARFVLQTRAAGADGGTEVVVNAGKILDVRACGRPVGTSVEVAHLFHPVPARRRFLKSDATESAHIVQVVRSYALAFPNVRFSLAQDGRDVFRSPQCPSLAERVAEIFGRELAGRLVPIEAAEGGWGLAGLIGRPGSERSGRQEFLAFVNRRPVESRAFSFAVIDSYRESLPKGKYPAAFLFLTCDPAAVDVNVHPTKHEVRFRQDAVVREFVTRSVTARLRALGQEAARAAGASPAERSAARPLYPSGQEAARAGGASSAPAVPEPGKLRPGPLWPAAAKRLAEGGRPPTDGTADARVSGADTDGGSNNAQEASGMGVPPRAIAPRPTESPGTFADAGASQVRSDPAVEERPNGDDASPPASSPGAGVYRPTLEGRAGPGSAHTGSPPEKAGSAVRPAAASAQPGAASGGSKAAAAGWRWLGLVQGAYAVFEAASGLILLDLGAARERVWYERLKGQFREGPVPSQRLLLPIGLELDPIASAMLLDSGRFLAAHGFEVAEFGRHYFRIEAVPDWLEPGEAEDFLRELLTALREGRLDERQPDLAREALARMAAARVVRRRGGGTEAEARRLLDDLFATQLPLTGPAGRPTFVELNWNELARRFRKS